jgi:hypothetical protein
MDKNDDPILPNNVHRNIQIYLPGLCSLTYKILQPLIHLLSYIPIRSIAFLPKLCHFLFQQEFHIALQPCSSTVVSICYFEVPN